MNGLTLAYLGDAYYELEIRKHLINKGYTKVKELHQKAITYTSGEAQAMIIDNMILNDFLTENEKLIYKRGRNSSVSKRKNLDAKTYSHATGFEALIGTLVLEDLNRLSEVLEYSIKFIERKV